MDTKTASVEGISNDYDGDKNVNPGYSDFEVTRESQVVVEDQDPLSKMADFTISSSDSDEDKEKGDNVEEDDNYWENKDKETERIAREFNYFELKAQGRLKAIDVPKRIKEMDQELERLAGFEPKKIVRNRQLTDATTVFQCNAWDDVEWDEDQKKHAEEVVSVQSRSKMNEEKKEKLEKEADKNWDDFYKNHKTKFFRDRNWLFSEFPELEGPYGASIDPDLASKMLPELRMNESYPGENSNFKVLEVGCGVGNTVFPLLAANNNPQTYVYCCDFSPHAIELVKKDTLFNPARCTPFVLDVTEQYPTIPFPEGSIDVLTAIFVVSAISPAKFQQVIKNFHRFLKPGGLVLFRDYGRYDMAQLRFKDGRCIDENFYMRGDGTRVYFFTEEEVETMFNNEGFEKQTIMVDRRLQVNRIRQLKMYRVWVQAKFKKL